MVTLATIQGLLNARKNRVLTIAEACLPPSQFKAFKTLFLDEFGQKGLESDLERVLAEGSLVGRGSGGNIHAGKEVPDEWKNR